MPRFHCPVDLATGVDIELPARRRAPCAGAAPATGRRHHAVSATAPVASGAPASPTWAAATCACKWAPTTPSSARRRAPSTCWRASPPTSAWTGWSKSHRTGRGQHHAAAGRAQRAQAEGRARRQKTRPLAGRGRGRLRAVRAQPRAGRAPGASAWPTGWQRSRRRWRTVRPRAPATRLLLSLRPGTPPLHAAAGQRPACCVPLRPGRRPQQR